MAITTSYELNTSGNPQAAVDTQMPNHFVDQFSSNVYHLAQQKFSRLRQYARQEEVSGESKRIDRYAFVEARDKVGYNVPVEYSDTPQNSRWLTPTTTYRSEMVDSFGKLKMIHSPEAELTRSFAMTMGRSLDYRIIEALVSDAVTGKDASTVEPEGDEEKRVVQSAYSDTATSETGLTFESLLVAKEYFFAKESVQLDEDIVCVLTGQDVVSLLEEERLTSQDYQAMKGLVRGDLTDQSVMGFRFVRTELIRNSAKIPNLVTDSLTAFNPETGTVAGGGIGSLNAGARKVLFFTMNRAVALGISSDIKTRIDEIPEMFHGVQVLSTLDAGCVRIAEEEYLELLIGSVQP